MTLIAIAIFLISRFYTVNAGPVWFDSPEYLARFANPDFWQALSSGHYPLHAGYILLFKNLPLIPAQIVLALAGMIAFYRLTQSKTATIIASLLPIIWISQTTVMMEAAYVPLFLISLYLFKSHRNFVASIFFSAALLTHLAVLLWIPLILYYNFRSWKWLGGAIIITSVFNAYLISPNLFTGLSGIYLSKLGEHVQLTNFLPMLRNLLIPLMRNNTSLIVILAIISLFRRPTSNFYFLLSIFWILPSIVANQWWDSLLYGRHALIASFGLSLMAAKLLTNHRLLTSITITYLLFTVVPVVNLLNGPIPYLDIVQQIKELPSGGVLFDSHFARPQTANVYSGKTIYVNEPGWKFETDKITFVTSAALSDPYGLYSGPFLHSISLSYKNLPALYQYLSNKSFTKVSPDIYQITPTGENYPLKNLYYSPRRLDYYDPISQIWFMIKKIFVQKFLAGLLTQ